jgi:hypothetical protein
MRKAQDSVVGDIVDAGDSIKGLVFDIILLGALKF